MPRIARWLLSASIVFVAAYLLVVTSSYALARLMNDDTHRYADYLFYPWRENDMARLQGERLERRGLHLLAEDQAPLAASCLQASLARHPGAWRARTALAALQLKAGAKTRAMATLEQGLPWSAHEPGFITAALTLAVQAADTETWRTINEAAALAATLHPSDAPLFAGGATGPASPPLRRSP